MEQTNSTIETFRYSSQYGSKRDTIAILINVTGRFFSLVRVYNQLKKSIESKHMYAPII